MAIVNKLQVFNENNELVDYDILADDVKFSDGESLPDKLAEVEQEIADKVDKVPGKGLSTNDYTDADKTKLENLPTADQLTQQLGGKANKSEMSVVPGTGANADKTTITLKEGTSATVLTQHQDISMKANSSEVVKSISVNGGTPQTPTNGNVNVVVPTVVLDDAPTAGSNNGVKSGGVKQAIDNKLTQVVVNEMTGAADVITIDDADLAFIDEDGNIAMQVAEGHVETANFDSRQVATNTSAIQQLQSQIGQQGSVQTDVVVKEDADAAFDIADESGKVALRITSQGHIKTKGFDSANVDVFRQAKMDVANCVCHGYGSVSGTPNTLAYCINGYNAGFRVFEIDCIPCQDGKAVCGHSGRTVYKKGTSPVETTTIQAAAAANSAADVVANYSWDEGGTVAISSLESIIAKMCFGYRCIIWLDWQIGQAMLAASTYAKSLGVEKYVFHYLNQFSFPSGDAWEGIPRNIIATAESVSAIQSAASSYKKADNNVILKVGSDKVSDNTFTDEELKALAAAAHDAGCLMMSSVFTNNKAGAQRAILCGFDFVIASGASEYNVNTITNLNIFD